MQIAESNYTCYKTLFPQPPNSYLVPTPHSELQMRQGSKTSATEMKHSILTALLDKNKELVVVNFSR